MPILPFSQNLVYIVLALLLSRAFVTILYFAYTVHVVPAIRQVAFLSLERARSLAWFGGWITLSGLISPNMIYLDRFVVGTVVTLSSFTYYTTSFELVARLSVIADSVTRVFYPAMSVCAESNRERMYLLFERALKFLVCVFLSGLFLVVVFARELLGVWLGSDFAQVGGPIMQILMVGTVFNCLARVPFYLLHSISQSRWVGISHLIQFCIALPAFFYFSAHYGIRGAAWVSTVRMFADFLILSVFVLRGAPQYWFTFLRLLALMAFVATLAIAIEVEVVSLHIKIIICLAAVLLGYFFAWRKFLSPADRVELFETFQLGFISRLRGKA